jgi:hypothetical protein
MIAMLHMYKKMNWEFFLDNTYTGDHTNVLRQFATNTIFSLSLTMLQCPGTG